MPGRRTTIIITEALSIAVLTGAVNALFPDNPGFQQLYYIPYFFGALLFAAVYGVWPGFVSLAASATVIAGALPVACHLIYTDYSYAGYWPQLISGLAIPAPIGILSVYIFGVVRSTSKATERRLMGRIEKITKENWILTRKSNSLFAVNLELEERVSKQRDSITSLYKQFQKLNILDLTKAFDVLLETVQLYTGATKLSVWKYDEREDSLLLEADRGFDEEESTDTAIPLDETIEGWVFRNTSMFSVRMVLQYDNLMKMDVGRNLITFPLVLHRKCWGVLNICEMPFEKYNLFTERLLHIIISLAEHSLEDAIFYESIIETDEVDEVSGMPLFSQFYRMLEEETRRTDVRKGDFSVILVELVNYPEIIREQSVDAGKHLIRSVADEISVLAEYRPHIFHYKDDSQIGIIYPNLDSDGVSLFCLEILERINDRDWSLGSTSVYLEAIVGFSVFSGDQVAEAVLEAAELILNMQKL